LLLFIGILVSFPRCND